MENALKNIVFSKNTIEFTTVAVQYCSFLEGMEAVEMEEAVDKLTKILPLFYLKATLLPENEIVNEDEPEITVTEADYNYMSNKLYQIFGKNDTYLEVFMQDMKYSETPIAASISEDLSDIYQDVKNYIAIYERGIVENMNDALFVCTENFKSYWGQKLVNVLRALHQLKYMYLQDENTESDEDCDEIW